MKINCGSQIIDTCGPAFCDHCRRRVLNAQAHGSISIKAGKLTLTCKPPKKPAKVSFIDKIMQKGEPS